MVTRNVPRQILSLRNHGWNITARVLRNTDGTYTINVYNGDSLAKSHDYSNIRKALISACDIVGED